jgi:hypothetical protein
MRMSSGAIFSRVIRLQPCRPGGGGKGIAPAPFVYRDRGSSSAGTTATGERLEGRRHGRHHRRADPAPTTSMAVIAAS